MIKDRYKQHCAVIKNIFIVELSLLNLVDG